MMNIFSQGYALLIGVDEHSVPAWSLPAVAKDLSALHGVLTHPQRGAYPLEHVHRLQGRAATRAALLTELDWLQAQIATHPDRNATAVVYYSGHGWRNPSGSTSSYYLIPHDTQPQPGTSLPKPATALRADEFAEAIAALNPQRLLVILDCCHAAGLEVKEVAAWASSALPVELFLPQADQPGALGAGGKGLGQLATGHGRAILSSSQGDERSYVRRDRTMSIFTYHLIEALTGHAQPQSGATEVLVSDILGHVHRHVPVSALAQAGQPQHPDYKVTGNFPVALLLGGKGVADGQPAPDPLAPLPTPPAPHQATNSGSGAVAQGSSTAAGERGWAIGGDARGNTIITGDGNRVHHQHTAFDQRGQRVHGAQTNITGNVDTGGGPAIFGNVNTGGGDFVGRDVNTIHHHAQSDLTAELRKLLTAIVAASEQGFLDVDSAIDAEAAVRKAIRQTEQGTPDQQTILRHLLTAQDLLKSAAGAYQVIKQLDGVIRLLG